MKKIIIAAIAVLMAVNAYSQTKKNDLKDKLLKIETLSADFIQTNTLKDFGDDIYSGKVYIKIKDKALWDYTEPYSSWYLFTQENIEQYDEINNQLVKYKAKDAQENVILKAVMDISSIENEFSSKQIDKTTLRLTPKTDVGIKSLDIIFDEKGVISGLKSYDGAGNTSFIEMKNVKLNQSISDGVFKKKLPKDVNIFEN